MDIIVLLKGIAVGFCVAVPIGPVGILCIQRTLSQGRLFGIVFGLGVATADALYGSVASFGLTFISNFILSHRTLIKLIGGIFLLIVGSKKILDEKSIATPRVKKTNLLNGYRSAFFFTLTNPITIIIFATVFNLPWINIDASELSLFNSFLSILGIFIGSALWFAFLSIVVDLFRTKFSKKYINLINILSGSIILAFGAFSILSILLK